MVGFLSAWQPFLAHIACHGCVVWGGGGRNAQIMDNGGVNGLKASKRKLNIGLT